MDQEWLEFWARAISESSQLVFVLDRERRVVAVSRALAKALRREPAELVGCSCAALMHTGSVPETCPLRELLLDGGVHHGEVHSEALGCDLFIAVMPLPGSDGTVVGAMHTAFDISERKRAEAALRTSELRYAQAQEVGHVGSWEYDPKTAMFWGSVEARRIYGFDPDRSTFSTDEVEGCTPERERVHQALVDLLAKGKGFDLVYEILPGDGAEAKTIWSVADVQSGPGGEPLSVTGVVQDITARKRAEDALLESEKRYRALFEDNKAITLLIDPETTAIVDANSAAVDFYGYPRQQLCALKISDIHTLPADELRGALAKAQSGQVSDHTFRHRLADGELRDVEVNSGPLEVNGRRLLLSIVHDVTERTRAQAALRESERRFAEFAKQMPGRLWIRDQQLRYLYMNPQLAADLGGIESDFLGKTPEELWDAKTAATAREMCRRAQRGEVVDTLERWPDEPGGGYFRSLVFALGGEGETPMLGGLMYDVTEQHAAQAAMTRQSERLRRTLEGTVIAMSQVVETRDPYTAGHERRVTELAGTIAARLRLADEDADGLRMACLIHDIGKIAVPAEILAKPGKLSVVEFELVKQHARAGFEIIEAIEFEQPVAQIVLQHHERLDGSGYPQGLSGDEVLPGARILAVADVVEAMSSHRPYRAALGIEPALAEIRENAGVKYDAEVVVACDRAFASGFEFGD